jgi:murein DD-endopeptidase MepM/ murein hydrolase activator NlpD
MPRFTFPFPVKPWRETQKWGVRNDAYKPFGYGHHNGVDVAIGADRLIRAPFAGQIVRAATKENGEWQPQGGGIFVSLLSNEPFTFDDGVTAFVLADFLHCEHLIVKAGASVEPGFALAYADNTGFSTGHHTHIQLRREKIIPAPANAPTSYRVRNDFQYLMDVDRNDANNSFDPTPYCSGTYVIDDALRVANSLLSRIKEVFGLVFKGRSSL